MNDDSTTRLAMIGLGRIGANMARRLARAGDTLVDGGNANYLDSQRRAAQARERGVGFVDCGVSGGLRGLELGYCLSLGGEADTVARVTRFARGHPPVLACSALRQRYRERLAEGLDGVLFVHLSGSFELIAARVGARAHRYMPASLLRSQFDALEPPQNGLDIDVALGVQDIVDAIVARIDQSKVNE